MNKRLVKIIVICTVVLSTMLFLSACSSKLDSTKDTFSDILDRGYVVVGLDDTFAPMGFRDDKDEIIGFDIDLAKEVFNRLDIKVKFQPIDWSMKEAELNSGNIDLIWNGYTITEERKEKVQFTKAYLDNRQVIITLSNSEINKKEDLANKSIALQSGSSSLDAVNREPEIVKSLKGGEPILFSTNNEAFMDLEAGRVDAVVADEILARYYINERGANKYKVLEEDFGKEEYGIGVRKSDKTLLKKVESTLDAMNKDGTCEKISKKWFGENIIKE